MNNLYKGTFNRCFLTSFSSFDQAVSEEKIFFYKLTNQKQELSMSGGHCGRDRIAVGFITRCAISVTTKVVSLNPVHGEVYSIHYVIKFVSDL